MLGGVAVLLAADEAEVAVLPAEEEDVRIALIVALDAYDALVVDGDADLVAVQVGLIFAEELIDAVLVAEIEGEVAAGIITVQRDDEVFDAVFVDVGFGRDDGLVGAGLVNVRDGFARRLENRLAPGGQRKGAERKGEENLFHFAQIGYTKRKLRIISEIWRS